MATLHETKEDYNAHIQTYEGFLGVLKWTVGIIVVLLILMAFFLV